MYDLEITIGTDWLATKKHGRCLALQPATIDLELKQLGKEFLVKKLHYISGVPAPGSPAKPLQDYIVLKEIAADCRRWVKESIHFEGKQDLQTKVMVALFGLFAEVERDLISQRTKEGLAAARAKGQLLGRPKGALGKSKLDGKEEEIRMLLEKTVSKASIAKIVGVSSTNLRHFIRTRKLDP